MVLEYISLALGLEALAERIVKQVLDLPGTRSHFTTLIGELQTLKHVLDRVMEYGEGNVSQKTQWSLERCIDDTKDTCEEMERLVNRVIHWKQAWIADLMGSLAKKPTEALCRRLERNKSTLNVLLNAMRIESKGPPPDYPEGRKEPCPPYTKARQAFSTMKKVADGMMVGGGVLASVGLIIMAVVHAIIPVAAAAVIGGGILLGAGAGTLVVRRRMKLSR
ncbi:uncharacterized protein LY89DRAFT_673134 [Mollisia scopiformis]|uniref:Uncharacterized protein n=1 Tax=Mollisia scopiformis TaxID=149040 RepID=A0A194WZ99_MOLSC|nr:uncharacterized protein LY89DRAFT_673134 [Mollisia scopiformis]KUJ13034.1 hypothetical protein LY89DRAFT_673134 [Mollisia scopiformis]